MGVFDKYNGLGGRLPVQAIKGLVVYGARPVWGRVMGASLNEPEIRRRAMEMPVHKAELGAATMREGIQGRDDQLRHLGEAMVAQALTDADNKSNDLVVGAAVTEVAASLPLDDMAKNPYIGGEVADRVTAFLGKESPPKT